MRQEFSKQTKREALDRAQNACEAEGRIYGLEPGQRCNMPLNHGVEFDHYVLAANGGTNEIENCRAVCKSCHRYKTRTYDTPLAAKTQRQQDKFRGVKKRSFFPKRVHPWGYKPEGGL